MNFFCLLAHAEHKLNFLYSLEMSLYLARSGLSISLQFKFLQSSQNGSREACSRDFTHVRIEASNSLTSITFHLS